VDDDDPPWFEADETSNAVIVRGRLSRMSEYGYLIQRLDQRPMLVELEAVIIDVSTDSIDSLGIDWTARGGKGSISVSPKQGAAANPVSGNTGGGFTIGTLWTNAGRELLTRIDLLSSKGQARVVARPKVLGVANRPAVMQEKRVAAVRVAGNLDAQLYQLEAGTLLQVTPQVTETDGTARMKLAIYIEDGNFESNQVDNVPIVKRTEIRTEAHVVEGESLLIGGITVEAQASGKAAVPGLSRIPLLGGLFRSGGTSSARSERLFLITPKLVREADHLPPPKDNEFDDREVELPKQK
jgi:type III secretion protein C